jgi:signal peptidase I
MARVPDTVEEREERAREAQGPTAGSQAPGGEVVAGSPSLWREAWTTLGLAFFFPGTGHVYAGQPRRGLLWSALFLLLVFPLVLFAYGLWYSFSRTALGACALFLLVFLVVSAVVPVAAACRRARARRGRVARPGVRTVALYASGIAILTAGETLFFLNAIFESRRVVSARLEPLLARGGVVTVLRSRYVNPVHGDVVLYEDPAASEATERLARVLAVPGDAVEARGGRLLVNGIPIDLAGGDQRLELETAGRAERRKRFLSSFTGQGPARFQDGDAVEWGGADWGPRVVPGGAYLFLPDAEPKASIPAAPGASGLIVPKRRLRGRVLL